MSHFKKLSSTILFSTTVFLSYTQDIPEKNILPLKADTANSSIGYEVPSGKEKFPLEGIILPTAMLTYGVLSLTSNSLKNVNKDLHKIIWIDNPHKPFHLESYIVLVPAAGAFALEAFGVKGKNTLRDKSVIYLMSGLLGNTAVYALKKTTHSLRPDSSNSNSFPSGHTAQAFTSAEFLRKEYKNVSAWYGIAGYTIAVTTAYLRLYNNRHWLGDVVAAAGIGIASVKLAYWLYPKIQHWIFKNNHDNTAILPFYNNGSLGIGITHVF
ncbi:MAG: phosphatase PAP2 family protein [Chitinophagaceae bacterium]